MSKKNKTLLIVSYIMLCIVMYMIYGSIHSIVYTFNIKHIMDGRQELYRNTLLLCFAKLTCPIACLIDFSSIMFSTINYNKLTISGYQKNKIIFCSVMELIGFSFSIFAYFYLSYAYVLDKMPYVLLVYIYNSISLIILFSIFWLKKKYLKSRSND